MAPYTRHGFMVGLSFLALACSPDATDGDPNATLTDAASTVTASTTDSGVSAAPVGASGSQGTPVRDSGTLTPVSSGTGAVDSGSATSVDSGSVDSGSATNVDSGANSHDDAGTTDAGGGGGGDATSLTGTYGSLGAVKPVVASYVISTGLETIIYLSSAPLTCAQIMTPGGRWLLMLPTDAQVLEIVVRGAAKVGTNKIGPAEANYAKGGVSSATEKVASSGTLTFTKVESKGVIEGTVTATYSGGGSVMGNFHAEFCQGGQEW